MLANFTVKKLTLDNCQLELLENFNRYQEIKRCWRKEDNVWVLKDIAFIEQWGDEKKSKIVAGFKECIKKGGIIIAVYLNDNLIAFSCIENRLFGSKNEYINLDSIQVSYEFRRHGLGRLLFNNSCEEAKILGAKKLYISANSSEETQAFYKFVGCCETAEINRELFEKEPFDVHMEYSLYLK